MVLRPYPRAAPIRWPIEVKLLVAFGLSACLTGISLLLGWASFHHVQLVLGSGASEMKPILTALAVSRIVIMGLAIAVGFAFGRLIAIPYNTLIERMEALSNGDLDSPIPFMHHRDCIGRIAKAIQSFRDNAIARNAAAELNARQSRILRRI
jgi:methyl-accepting chemotaxis protein